MRNVTVVEETPAYKDDYLDADEISAGFEALSADDKLKLGAIETTRRSGTEFGPSELIQEALCRALLGKRKCPRDVTFMAFLVETMRSIASHAREERKRVSSLQEETMSAQISTASGNPGSHQETSNPEEHMIARQDSEHVQAIFDHFEDDQEALLVLMGWAEGLRGRALREATDLDQSALDYAGKRIRTRMRKLYPDGWRP